MTPILGIKYVRECKIGVADVSADKSVILQFHEEGNHFLNNLLEPQMYCTSNISVSIATAVLSTTVSVPMPLTYNPE